MSKGPAKLHVRWARWLLIACVALAYVAAGRLGLHLEPVSGFATLVWPPSGIALASLLLLGNQVWPGIAIGAFLVNLLSGAPIPIAMGITAGNTVAAIGAAWALRRVTGFRTSIDRVPDVIALITISAIAPLISATVGSLSLLGSEILRGSQFAVTWLAWWLGDVIGIQVMAPVILAWASPSRVRLRSSQGLEALAVLSALAGLAIFIFHAPAPLAGSRFWEPYMLAPVMVWIALRFSPREAATGVLIVSAIAVAYTAQGMGPFAGGPVFEDLLFLQTFVSIGAITFLLLAAAMAERLLAEHERVAVLTRERVARAEAEHAERRSAFLYRATTALLGNLDDSQSRLELVARLVSTHVAGFCIIDSVELDGGLRRLTVAHADPGKARAVDAFAKLPPDLEAPALIARSIREGRTLVQKVPAAHGQSEAGDPDRGIRNPEVLRLLEEMGLQEYVTVPLLARERVIGALTAATMKAQQSFEHADILLLEDLALRIALALDNSRLHNELLHANQAKSDFLAVMSHELRTPLTAIIGYADLMETGISGPLTGKQKHQLDRIKASSDHLRGLIEEILTFSRLDVGREEVRMEHVDLAALVSDVAAIVEPLVKRKGLNLVEHVADEPTPVTTDPKKLRQILLNLLSNAVKFTAAGEIELTAGVEGEDIVVVVRDTGIGILAVNQEKIFDPFWQVDHGPTRSTGGAGLGLTVSRRLARLMGGEITVTSVPRAGSTFTLRLPSMGIAEPATTGGRASPVEQII